MAVVRIVNRENQELPVNPALSLLQLLQRAGVAVPTRCGGHARCGFCRITFLEGLEHSNSPNVHERQFRNTHSLPENVRLACQTYLFGQAVIKIGQSKEDNAGQGG